MIFQDPVFVTVFELALLAVGVAGLAGFHRQRLAAQRRILAAEAEGLDYRRRLLALSAFSNDAVLLLDGDGRIVDANARAELMYGWSRAELLGLTIRDLRAPEERGGVDGHMETLRQNGELRVETRHVRKDGSTFAVESGGKLLGTAPEPRYQIIVRDIDVRKADERARQESEERWRTIATAAHDAIITMDNRGLVTYWNPAAERLFGYSADEVLEQNLHDVLMPERYMVPHLAAFSDWQRTGRGGVVGKTVEFSACRKDGTECEVELSLASVLVDGRWQAVGVLRDVSSRKRADADLRRAKEAADDAKAKLLSTNSLLQSAAARARELAEQAQAANVAKSDFLANMSHEIRTPMNAIIGMSGLLLDTSLTAEQREQAEIIRSSADALLAVINEILDYSKVESGKIDLEIMDFDLRLVVEETIDMLAVQAEQKGLQLACLVGVDVPTRLRGDPGRLRQVLVNLVGNAIKFTPTGEVSVSVTWERRDDERAAIHFCIRDTGVGIPEDAIARLFQSFSQVDASITRRFGGTGLGLAIAKRLVNLMGGDITVQSAPGEGSAFSFTALFDRQTGAAEERITLPAGVAPPRVLVVDDHPTNRLVLGEQLRALGCPSESASDAAEALAGLEAAACRREPFDVAIIDAAMPDVDGETLAGMIAQKPALAGVRLVLCSSRGSRGDQDRLRALRFSAFLAKPLRLRDLRDCLIRVVGPAVGATASPPASAPGSSHQGGLVQGRQSRALVVDDNTVNQKLAVRLLEKLGIRADAVGSGREALAAVALVPYDLVFMDVQMPDLDGFETTRAIRAREGASCPRLPIVAMTAHAMKGDRERCLEAGMDGYVSKPIERETLRQAVEAALGGERRAPMPEPVAAATADSGIFDACELAARTEGDAALMHAVIESFLAEMPAQQAELTDALDAGDFERVRRMGHQLKGSAGTIGARALCAASAGLERAGHSADLAVVRDAAAAVQREVAQLLPALSAAAARGIRPPESTLTRSLR